MPERLPLLFFDRELPPEHTDLVTGRARVCGPDDSGLAEADAVVAALRRWDDAAMASGPKLKVISRIGVGYDTVDVAAATARGIVVCHAPDAPTVSTAEHTIGLLLAVTKRLPALMQRAADGLAAGKAEGMELDGRVLGLLGYGRIARRVARTARALGMDTIAHDPFMTPAEGDETRFVSTDDLWRYSDVITLHAPATTDTHHVVDDATFSQMKPGAFLVNCARGSLVDHVALLGALDDGRLAGAGLDVTEPEPLPSGHPLLSHPRVIVTPHMASSTVAGRRRLYTQAIDNALAVLSGLPATVVPEQGRRS
ncbi:MAG TPA: NAD(P)-dependent oxidoreductase [Acidimicrobiales bacterium]